MALPNPFGISDHDARPQEVVRRHQKLEEREAKHIALEAEVAEEKGRSVRGRKDWVRYFKLSQDL